MRIMPISNNYGRNTNQCRLSSDTSFKAAKSESVKNFAKLMRDGYRSIREVALKDGNNNYFVDENGKVISRYSFVRKEGDKLTFLVTDRDYKRVADITVARGYGNKIWCESKEPFSEIRMNWVDSKGYPTVIKYNYDNLNKELINGDSFFTKEDFKKAVKEKDILLESIREGYIDLINYMKNYRTDVKYLHINTCSQKSVDIFRTLGFIGADFNPKTLINQMYLKIAKPREIIFK